MKSEWIRKRTAKATVCWALITCEHVCLGYDGQTVLRDVNFTVSRGDLLCVVGENGSGKSTLIKGLLGLKAPEQGSITLGDGLVRSEIGYLPQQTQLQRDFPASVAEVGLLLRQRLGGTGERQCADTQFQKEVFHRLIRF